MLEGLTEEIAEAAEVLARSRITFEGAVYVMWCSCRARRFIGSCCHMRVCLSRLRRCRGRKETPTSSFPSLEG